MPAETLIQMRRGPASVWTSVNPTLAAGEFGVETDTGLVKMGVGDVAWNDLDYVHASWGAGLVIDTMETALVAGTAIAVTPDGLSNTFTVAVTEVGTAQIADDAVTTSKLPDDAVTDAKVDHTVEVNTQGRRTGTGLRAWEAAWADVANTPVKMVCLRDSHGELGIDKPFFTRCRARHTVLQDEPNALSAAGRWVPARDAFGLIQGISGSHSGAVASTAGPAGYAAEIDTGDWVQFGGWVFTQLTGFTVFGVGEFDISVNGGPATPVTLAAGESFDSGTLASGAHTCRVTATSDGSVVWGSYLHLTDNDFGFQAWTIAHSGWAGHDLVATPETWDLVEAIDPDLVLLGFATNQGSAEEFASDLQDLIAEVRAVAPDASLCVWFPFLASSSGNDEEWWDDAEKAAKQIARANGAVLCNLYPSMGDISGANDKRNLSDDGTHLNSKGTAVACQILSDVLLGVDQPVASTDPTGQKAAKRIRVSAVYPGQEDVWFTGGNAVADVQAGSITNEGQGAFLPFYIGAPPDGSAGNAAAVTRSYADSRYVLRTLTEQTAPAAPAANQVTLFARDNGAGKTQLCARFNTGAIQVIATEP